MVKKSEFMRSTDRIAKLPKERRQRIQEGARKILQDMHLAELRKALNVSQTELAGIIGIAQPEVSRVEQMSLLLIQLKTIERYVNGLGGELNLVASFPDGLNARIPLQHGKAVKSRMVIEEAPDANENYAEARLAP